MSIKIKLTLGIFMIALTILCLNIWMFYEDSTARTRAEWENGIIRVTKDVADSSQSIFQASERYEAMLGDKLRGSLEAAGTTLEPEYGSILNERLTQLGHKWAIPHLELIAIRDGGLQIVASSDGLNIGTMLPDNRSDLASVRDMLNGAGEASPASGPLDWVNRFDYSFVKKDRIEKRAFLYKPGSDYVLSGYIQSSELPGENDTTAVTRIIDKIRGENPDIIDIAILNGNSISSDSIQADGSGDFSYWNRPFMVGSSRFLQLSDDQAAIKRAVMSGGGVSYRTTLPEGGKAYKFFYRPLGQVQLIVMLTAVDDSIGQTVRKSLLRQIKVSAAVLLVVLAAGYVLSSVIMRPLGTILYKVNQIAIGSFGPPIVVNNRDDLGKLAAHINRMSANLESYTNRLEQTARELRSTKEYLESFVGNTSDAIHVIDLAGNVLLVNNAFESLYGWNSAELADNLPQIVPGLQEEEAARLVRKVMQGGVVNGYESVGIRKNGEPIDVSVTVSPIRDGKGSVVAYATITRNMTDRKQSEELLRRSEKLSIVGQLAAGVAHEIRNPLTTLRGFVQLQQRMNSGNPNHLELMLSELDRINFIVSEFLILAKPQATHFEFHDPSQILKEILVLLESQAIMNNVEFCTEIDEGLPKIHCESNQLKQVFVNLFKNAIEAMPEGGRILIEVRSHSPMQVLIRITDHGTGMPEEQLSKLGEPFYTNKENGTGLGLVVCHQIVNGHKGNMLIRSMLGVGTTVDIVLPVREQ